MGRIPEETIQAIRDRSDIVDLVGRYVALRQTGRTYKGLCPFHSEKTPSFHVHPERQIFHCFGCGAGGDVLSFLIRHENLTFPEAARTLARECGIDVPEEQTGESGLVRRLEAANERAQCFYRDALRAPEGAAARAYLTRRGLDAETIERFGIGFAPARWDALTRALADAGIPAEIGARAGLLAERARGGHYDRLRDRVVFPIRDVRGRVVGFGGRALAADAEPKYLNTPESPLFRKREAFYGLPEALESIRRRGRAVVVEGYFDRIALHRAGVGEGLATCGTALTPDHARNLRRRTREVVLLFDGDEAGIRAAERALELLLPEGLRVRTAALPAGDDPDTLLAREGAEALRRVVDEAPPALEGAIRRAVARGCGTPWEKADAVAAVAPLVGRVADPIERSEFARRLALATGTELRDVFAAVQSRGGNSPGEAEPPAPAPRRVGPEARAASRVARLLLDHPDLGAKLERDELLALVAEVPPWDRVLTHLVEAACEGEAPVAALAEALDAEAAAELRALAVDDAPPLDTAEAERALVETLRKLREWRDKARRHATTQRMREAGDADPAELLHAKQRELEERRAQLGLDSPRPASGRA